MRSIVFVRRLLRQQTSLRHDTQRSSFHFASTDYTAAFQNLPTPDVPKLRASVIQYLETFDETKWYTDPVCLFLLEYLWSILVNENTLTPWWSQIASLLNGKELRGGASIDTINALGIINGKQDYATAEQVEVLKQHIQTFSSPQEDLREPLRKIEQKFLTEYTGLLIGNQCLGKCRKLLLLRMQ